MKISTNHLRKEILDLKNVGFQLPQSIIISMRRVFGMEELLFDLSSYPNPTSADDHVKTRSGKNIRRNKNAPTTNHTKNCTSSLTLKGHLCQVTMISHLGFGCIIILDFGVPPKIQQYLITICSFPESSYQYFKNMAMKSLGKRGQWIIDKHLYFVFTIIAT